MYSWIDYHKWADLFFARQEIDYYLYPQTLQSHCLLIIALSLCKDNQYSEDYFCLFPNCEPKNLTYFESTILHSSLCFWDSSVLLYIAVVHSFLLIYNLLIHPILLLVDIVVFSLDLLGTSLVSLVDFQEILLFSFTSLPLLPVLPGAAKYWALWRRVCCAKKLNSLLSLLLA